MSRRSRFLALVLSLFGFLGLHRFYLGRFWTGLLMLVTVGGIGIWWILDFFLLLTGKLKDGDNQELTWLGGKSETAPPEADAPTLQQRVVREQAQATDAAAIEPVKETRRTAGMTSISLPGQTKVSTLQERFKSEFGLTLRVYDGRRYADPDATIGQVRKKRGATSVDIRRNTKVGNLEDRFLEEFGIKVQIAGSDDSYLCDDELTLAAALAEDERKLSRRAKRSAYDDVQNSDDENEESGDTMITASKLLRDDYIDILEEKENKLMETGAWSEYVEDSGGELNVISFFIEKTETGFIFVAQLTVSGINALSEESQEAILDDIEAMTDDMDEDFESVGLNSEDLEDFRIIIDRDDGVEKARMRFEIDVVFNNADTGETDERVISFETHDSKTEFLVACCRKKVTEQTLEQLFKHLYDNPNMDGSDAGVAYEEIWNNFSHRAFDKLGWHDVTVDVIGLKVDGEQFEINLEIIDYKPWSLQLSREGFMYCYA